MRIFFYVLILAVIYLLWTRTLKKSLRNLSCTRSFSRLFAFEGDEGELIEVVRNDKFFLIPWLRLESYISPKIQVGHQENLDVNDEQHYCSLFSLMPYQQIQRKHYVKFLRRGVYNLGNASLTVGDVLGISRFQRSQELDVPILVYPRLLEEREVPAPMSRMIGELSRRKQLQEDPFLVRGIRQYIPGDPVRDIHWPATARTNDVQVRVHDFTTRLRLLVVLNAQCEPSQVYDRAPQQYEEALEYGISVAATLCVQALRNGLAAGFASNMPQGRKKDVTLLLPRDGADREEEILAALAHLELIRTYDFAKMLGNLSANTGLDILVLSLYDTSEIQSSIRQLRRSGNQVTFCRLEGGGV